MTNCVKGLRCFWGYPANELVDIVFFLNRMIILDRLIVKKLIAH